MAKLFIATPMYGGMCTGHYTQSILQLQGLCQQNRIDMAVSFMFNESLITRARNSLTHGFLRSGFSHLMFIDADIKFNPADVVSLLLADKDVICGIYPKKEINWNMVKDAVKNDIPVEHLKYYSGSHVVNLADRAGYAEFDANAPAEIWNGGTGFMMIKREVFDKLAPTTPSYINNAHDLSGNMGAEEIKEFFATSIEPETQHLLSEDYHFCRSWREAGGKVHAAPWVQLGHVGTYLFDGALAPKFPEKE